MTDPDPPEDTDHCLPEQVRFIPGDYELSELEDCDFPRFFGFQDE